MEKLTITARARTRAETVSLGFLVARHYFWPLWAWVSVALLPVVALALISGGFLFSATTPALTRYSTLLLMVAWLRPWIERPALILLNRLLRGESATMATLPADFRRAWRKDLWGELLWRRFSSAARIPRMSVALLEDSPRDQPRQRGSWRQQIALSLLEFGLFLTLILFSQQIITSFDPNRAWWQYLNASWYVALWFFLALVALSISVVFALSVNFLLYLDQRITQQGGAIAADLRALAQRLLLVVMLLSGVSVPKISHAAPTASAEKTFLLHAAHDPAVTPLQQRRIAARSAGVSLPHLAPLLRAAIVVILGAGAVWLLLILWPRRGNGLFAPPAPPRDDLTIMVERVHRDPDPVANAERALSAGENIAALAILYRATRWHAQKQWQLPVQRGDSEQRYLQRAENCPDCPRPAVDFLRRLLFAWQNAVYAGRAPSKTEIAALIHDFARVTA